MRVVTLRTLIAPQSNVYRRYARVAGEKVLTTRVLSRACPPDTIFTFLAR